MESKITNGNFIFYVSYFIYFTSMFLEDLALMKFPYEAQKVLIIIKALKLVCLITLVLLSAININKLIKRKNVFILLAFGIIFLFSRDFYWIILSLLAINYDSSQEKNIFKISAFILILYTCITILFCSIGVLPNIITRRSDFDLQPRYSLGFSHSNILPLIIFYVISYIFMLISDKKNKVLTSFNCFLITIIIYNVCDSRNALMASSIILFLAFIYYKKNPKRNFPSKVIGIVAVTLSILSIALPIMHAKKISPSLTNNIDRVYTARISKAAYNYKIFGLHFLNKMSSDDYRSKTLVIDNAYMYSGFRYGLYSLILFYIIIRSLREKYKEDKYASIVILAIVVANFTDNDFFSYGVLPYFIVGLNYFSTSKQILLKRIKPIAKKGV